MTGTRGEAVETTETIEAIETARAGKDGNESKSEYPENLTQVLCIWYSITFRKKSLPVLALIDSGNKINVIYPTYVRKLGLSIKTTDVGVQKIDSIILNTFEMVVAAFSVTDKANQVRFFEKTFLVANVSPKKVFVLLFLTLNGANIDFFGQELW